jgi:uncharacterized protein YxeA
MKKRAIGFLLISSIVITGFIYYNNTYSEFQPLAFENDVYKKIEVDATFYQNLKIVLDYHQEHYKINSSGKLKIKRKIHTDKELVFNYTTKALDTIWVKNHKTLE